MAATNAAFTPARPARFDASQQHRRSMLAKIQIARKDLAMDEDDYRQIVLDKTGRMSLKEASERDLAAVLDVMKAKGFRPPSKGKAPVAQHPMARKARALWISLYHLNVVHNPAEQALEAFAARQLGCEKLVWARQSDAYRLIEALKDMARRAGWKMTNRINGKPLQPLSLQSELCYAILAKLQQAGVAPTHWTLHDAAWKLCGIENAKSDGTSWSAEDYARLASQLGDKLRNHGGARG